MKSVSKKIVKLAVVGSRHYMDKSRLFFELDEIRKTHQIEIISGCEDNDKNMNAGRGADQFALQYAKKHKLKYTGFPPEWQNFAEPCIKRNGPFGWHNALAGPNRNTKIIQACDCVIAFWNGETKNSGTYDSMEKAEKFGKRLKTIKIKDF